MWTRTISLGLLATLIISLGAGCNKSAPKPSLLPPPAPETIARVRWLGKQQLAADTNAASLMAIWDLVEARNLEAQTLDRLAVSLLAANGESVISNRFLVVSNEVAIPAPVPPSTNRMPAFKIYHGMLSGAPGLLRPLLEDMLQRECFLEVRQTTNQPGDLVFAIKLAQERARVWETNLAQLLEQCGASRVAGAAASTNGWEFTLAASTGNQPRRVDLTRVGEWTLVALGRQTNALATELRALAEQTGQPFPRPPKGYWLYAEADLRRVSEALGRAWDLPAETPKFTLGLSGDGQSVRTRGQLDFPQPLPANLGEWNIPTNLIHDPLISFTAVRGLGNWPFWQNLWKHVTPGAPPSQFYAWAENGLPFLSFCAARVSGASNQVNQLAGRMLQEGNAWLTNNSQGFIERSTNANGLVWRDLPMVEPFLHSMPGSADDLLFGGLVSDLSTNRPPPALFLQVTGPTNLLAYDWEMTGNRVVQWLYFGQFFRMFLNHAQVPAQSPSIALIQALEFKLGNCVSALTQTGPAQLSFVRRSTIGLSSTDIHLLVDWLESPTFPRGLNTLDAPPDMPLHRKKAVRSGGGTNSTAKPVTPPAAK